MKFKKDCILEMMVRMYDPNAIERLDNKWKEYESLYSNRNTFIVDLILKGLDALENEDNTIRSLKESGNIFSEMKRITALLDRIIDAGHENYKESYVIGKEN